MRSGPRGPGFADPARTAPETNYMLQPSGKDGPAHSSPRRGIPGPIPRDGNLRSFPRTQQLALRSKMKSLRDVVPQLFSAQHDGSRWESKSILDPICGVWRGMHHQRRDLAAATALLQLQADSEGIELAWITIKPDIKPGSSSTYVDRTLRAFDALLREMRGLRGAWRRFVGTLTVTISAAGTPAWAAHPHLHVIAPTALADWIRNRWGAAELAVGLPADTRPDGEQRTHPTVHIEPIKPGPASMARLVRYLMQARWTNLSPEGDSHSLGAVAREGSRKVSRGNGKMGWAWLNAWRETVVAIWKSGVNVGLVSHGNLKHDAKDLVRMLELTQRTSSEDVETVVKTVLELQPHMRHADDFPLALLRHRDAEQRIRIDAAREDIRTHGGIHRPLLPGPARAAALSAVALVSPRGDCVHPWETSAPFPVIADVRGCPVDVVVPRARSPPPQRLVLALPMALNRLLGTTTT